MKRTKKIIVNRTRNPYGRNSKEKVKIEITMKFDVSTESKESTDFTIRELADTIFKAILENYYHDEVTIK